MTKRRILTGGIAQESHSFNPIITRRNRFTITEGQQAIDRARGVNSPLGGVVDAAEENGVELIVPCWFRSQSGGPVDDSVFAEISERMTNAARRGDFDAIVLPLHGGMLTESLTDPEGTLAQRLRDVVGKDVPITAGFDLHAHVNENTLAPLDFLAGYLTNPHEDLAATNRRAFKAAMEILDGTLDPVLAANFLPMLTLGNDTTFSGPLADIHRHAREAVKAGRAYDISVFNSQQFLDVPHLGQVVLAYGNGEVEEARKVSDEIMRMVWDYRDDLIGKYPSLAQELDGVETLERPVVLGDQGDRVAGGGPGDSTYILRYLLDNSVDVPTYFPVYDPDAVQRCEEAGQDAELTLTFGGNFTQVAPPVTAVGKVIGLGENLPVVFDGPSDANTTIFIERYAVFKMGNVSVLLTSLPYAYIDPAYFRAVGLPPEAAKIIVTRSGYHFTLNFAKTGRPVTVDTPGISSYYVDQLPWKHARPFYPLDNIPYEPRKLTRRRA